MRHRPGPLPVRGSQTVGAGVAAADDDHILALRADRGLGQITFLHPVRPAQILHRRVHPGQGAARHSQLAAIRSAAGEHDRVRSGPQLLDPEIDPDLHPNPEGRALGSQLIEAPVKPALLHPEFRDAVAQQAADPIGPLVDHHVVTGPGELLGGGQPRRTGADHGDHAPGPGRRPQRGEPPPSTGVVDDRQLHLLDRDRIGVDRQHAGVLARGRAQRAGELGEVVRGVQPIRRPPPLTPPDQLVPVRDQISQRATRVTKRHPAVHTPARLHPLLLVPHRLANLTPVPQAQLAPDAAAPSPEAYAETPSGRPWPVSPIDRAPADITVHPRRPHRKTQDPVGARNCAHGP